METEKVMPKNRKEGILAVFEFWLNVFLILLHLVFTLVSRRRFEQIDVLEGINVLTSISGMFMFLLPPCSCCHGCDDRIVFVDLL